MDNTFRTIKEPLSGEISEKKSRFIASIVPVKSEEEALAHIEKIKKLHRDARHNCWAYILSEGNISRSSDDGEPSGSAGKPMTDVIAGKGLKDVCAVVTRYFGGTLLGVGGLVRAYSGAVEEALKDAEFTLMTDCERMTVTCGYTDLGKVKNLIEKTRSKTLAADYAENVVFDIAVVRDDAQKLTSDIKESTADRAAVLSQGVFFCIIS